MVTVAISGMNARPDNPGPGVAVARCLREAADLDARIIGFGYDALDPGLYLKDYCDTGYLLPYPSAGDQGLLTRLEEIHKSDPFDVLIPCLDAELPNVLRVEKRLRKLGVHTWLPSEEQLKLRSKERLNELATFAQIACPRTRGITQPDFFQNCENDGWHFPLVVKGVFYDAYVAHSPTEAMAAFARIARTWGYPVLVQEHIKGEEYNLTGVGDGAGSLLGPVMMKKTGLTDKGKAWAGVAVRDQALLDAAEKLIGATQWRGPLEVEVIKSPGGTIHLVEINPRFPAWVYLSPGVGVNLPHALVNMALGRPLPSFDEPRAGTMFIRYALETIIDLSEFESIIVNGMRK